MKPYFLVKIILLFSGVFGMQMAICQKVDLPVYYYPFKTYSVRDGLTRSVTYSVFQDSKGFIWAGTREGINKFDGLAFENHLTNSIFPDDIIYNIYEDGKENIWFKGEVGIYKYDGDTTINIVKLLPDSIQNILPQEVAIDKKGDVWFTIHNNDKDIFLWSNQNLRKETIKIRGIENSQIKHLSIDGFGGLLIVLINNSSKKQTLLWRNAKGEEKFITPNSASSFNEIALFQNKDGIYIRFNNEIFLLDHGKLVLLKKIPIPFEIFAIRGKDVIISDHSRLYKEDNNEWKDFGIEMNSARQILVDKEDRIWLPTEEGLIKIESEGFQVYPTDRGMLRGAWSIVEDNEENIWFASYGYGLRRLNREGVYENVNGYEDLLHNNSLLFYPGAIKSPDGDLLFPTTCNVLSINTLRRFKELEHSYAHAYAIQDIKISNGAYYLATKGFRVIHNNGLMEFYSDDEGLNMRRLRYIEGIEIDKNNIWWLASHFGLAKFDGKGFKNYFASEDSLSGINTIFKDYKENLWFGSHKGLLAYDYSKELPYAVLKDTIVGSIKFISSIDSTYLVLGMLDRLVLINLQDYYKGKINFYELNEENGFEGEDCIQHSGYRDSKGNIWIATRTNVIKLIPSKIRWENLPSPIAFRSISIRNPRTSNVKKILLSDNEQQDIFIKSTDNLTIHFYTLNHTNPEKIRFQYWLKGYENDWSPASAQRYANYSNLPVGTYQLVVRSVLNSSYSETKTINIKVIPGKWYQAKWVSLLVILALITSASFIIFLVYRRRRDKRLALQQLLLKEHRELTIRHKLLLNQANPHFVFNILDHIKGLVIKEELLDARRYIGMFGEVFRPMLRSDEKLTWTLKEELEFVENYLQLEKLRFPDKFEYSINIEDGINKYCFIPKMIIQSFVNNSIKHGIEPKKSKDGLVTVSISQRKELLYISIEDNGSGISKRKKSSNSSSTGIQLIENTLQWLNEQYPVRSLLNLIELKNQQQEVIGTRVELIIFNNYKNI